MSASDEPEFEAPDEVLVNRRWISRREVAWAQRANEVMLEHGAVRGSHRYRARHQARWRAQKLINLMVDLALHERWELREHTEPRDGGWAWTVEYVGRSGDG